jgi:transposase
METDLQTLPDHPGELKRLLQQVQAECAALHSALSETQAALEAKTTALRAEEAESALLRERLRLYLQQRFGPSSEQSSADQLRLFNEAECGASKGVDEESGTFDAESDDTGTSPSAGTDQQVPRKRGRRPLPSWLERRDVIHDLPEDAKVCPHDGTALRRIGEETNEQLEYIPASLRVIRNIRPKYACPCCEDGVYIAPLPPQPIPKSMASPSLLAQIAVAKYCDALPLYRQAAIWERVEVDLSRTTMANWMIAVGQRVQPVINLLNDDLLAYDIACGDETRCQVLKEDGKTAQSQSYFWGRMGGPKERPIILFDYDPSRSSEIPKRLFEGFEGYLQVDGYAGYNSVAENPKIIRVGCLAHLRRKFEEARKAQSGAKTKPKGASKAHQGLAFIAKLYRIEGELRTRDPAERKAARETLAAPVLREMKAWLDRSQSEVPPKGLVGKAIAYARGQWESLCRYLEDGRLEIDNNRMENAIRPFVCGRKNWLFSDTVHGAEASANLYSLIETAKANGLEPYRYLSHLFTELPKAMTVAEIEQLLPTRWRPAPDPS